MLTIGAPNTTHIGTFIYMSPEMLDEEENYTRKVDVHSFGLVCSEILTGKLPFLPHSNVRELLRRGIRPCLPDNIPVTLKRMVNRCWDYDADKRPSFEEICDDLWIAKEMILVTEIDEQVLRCEIQELKFKLNETGSKVWSIPIMPRISTPTDKRAIYIFSHLKSKDYFVKNLPIDILVDIQLIDVDVQSSGHVEFSDPWNSVQNPFLDGTGVDPQNLSDGNPPENLGLCGQFKKLLKDQGKKFNLTLCIGGWEQGKHFSDAFSTSKNRNTFVNSVINLLAAYPIFNGIVIDWSYMSNNGINYGPEGNVARKEDGENFILVLQQLRNALPTGFYIAATCRGRPEEANWPVERTIDLLDGLYIITCYFQDRSFGEKVTSHHANLCSSSYGKWSADEAVKFYMGWNVPSSKIFITGALYSSRFANTDGIGMHAEGGTRERHVAYNALPLEGFEEKWDDEAKATYAHDPIRRVVYTYDNVRSIMAKAEYIKNNNLGGIVIVQASFDFPSNHERSIMKALHDHLTHG